MSKNSNQKVDKHLPHRIITSCGDANAMMGSKHINPALCIYLGAYLMCIDNKHLTRVVYRGGSSHFFGIGILPVSDILGIGIFGRYSRCVGKNFSFMVCRTPDPLMVGMRG